MITNPAPVPGAMPSGRRPAAGQQPRSAAARRQLARLTGARCPVAAVQAAAAAIQPFPTALTGNNAGPGQQIRFGSLLSASPGSA